MKHGLKMVVSMGLLAAVAGCYSDRPHDYGRERPPVTDLDKRDKGLQSKDVVEASDRVAMYLLQMPEVNQSPTRLTMVLTDVENNTTDPRFNYDIFLERLRTRIAMQGRDRIAIIENKARYHNLRAKELDERDDFGQGAGPATPQRIQPDFALYGKFNELRGRGTSYYLAEFIVTNLKSGEQWPLEPFEVKVNN